MNLLDPLDLINQPSLLQNFADEQATPAQKIELKNLFNYLNELKQSGINRAIPNISNNTAHVILQLLKTQNAKNILEVGCANGYSTLHWAAYCKYLQPVARLCSIDISAPMVKEAIDHLLKQKLHLYTEVYWGNALDVLPRFNQQFDAIFIDAQKAKTTEILKICLTLMKKNSLLVIDDVIKFADKMSDLFDFLQAKNITYQIVQTDEDDGILWALYT